MEITTKDNQLLNDSIHIRKRYALVDQLVARPFNIFSILRVERNERFTHSAFIAELLNPKGSHCQGYIFLKLFLNGIEWAEDLTIDVSKANVKVEQNTGNGFIDIWIDFGDAYICVENKIDAGDQPDQLHRYNQHCLKFGKPYKIIYLTLDGHSSENPKNNFEYEKWSYQTQVIPWLDKCIKESARIPTLRETIYQYQQLLKKICNMLQNENEASDLNDLLKKDFEHFEAANNIHEQFKVTKYQIKRAFWEDVEMYLSKTHNENFNVVLRFSMDEKHPRIYIGHKTLEEWYACFCIENIQGRAYYGIYSDDYRERSPSEKKIIDQYTELELSSEGYKSDEYWFSWKYYDNVDFYTLDTLRKTFSVNDRNSLIQQIVGPIDILIEKYANRILEINKEIHKKLS